MRLAVFTSTALGHGNMHVAIAVFTSAALGHGNMHAASCVHTTALGHGNMHVASCVHISGPWAWEHACHINCPLLLYTCSVSMSRFDMMSYKLVPFKMHYKWYWDGSLGFMVLVWFWSTWMTHSSPDL